jgi:hypothetical protein
LFNFRILGNRAGYIIEEIAADIISYPSCARHMNSIFKRIGCAGAEIVLEWNGGLRPLIQLGSN